MDKCDVKTGTCESGTESSGQCSQTPCPEKCPCGGHCGGDPVKCATLMWKCAFHTAMRAAMVDALKPKIQKAMGAKFDKAADAVLEAMLVKFQSMLAAGKAKSDLEDKFREFMGEGK